MYDDRQDWFKIGVSAARSRRALPVRADEGKQRAERLFMTLYFLGPGMSLILAESHATGMEYPPIGGHGLIGGLGAIALLCGGHFLLYYLNDN